MEENSMAMQTLVIAHAAFGHNHFFKNNGLFRQWTDAKGILDYMEFAKGYVAHCEERYGHKAVEKVMDAAHALMSHGVHKYPRKRTPDLADEERRAAERRAYQEKMFNDLWRTVPKAPSTKQGSQELAERKRQLGLPEENLLYFLEKMAPKLAPWQRELIRIVRKISQYFYPQKQTKMMNEGCATFVHYTIVNRMHELGMISDGAMLEILHSHTSVVFQPDFDDRRYSGLNPYALGFNMMSDIKRMCESPTAEDREWFPDFAGNGDPYGTLRQAWADFRDESFLLQYLSPALIRKMKLFKIHDVSEEPEMGVAAIHNERGYREVRKGLARNYDIAHLETDIQIVDVDLAGDRRLILHHFVESGMLLNEMEAIRVLRHIANLWGYEVRLIEIDPTTDQVVKVFDDVAPITEM
jgi:stage V sporulation protein R